MTSEKSTVRLKGVLRGGGLIANCVVVQKVFRQPTTGVIALGTRSIQSVTPTLPDGVYMLSVNGEETAMRLHGGLWMRAAP